MSKSNNNCCVVGCNNTYKNTNNIKFFNFPNRPFEKQLKELWIKAVNRLDGNGKLWQPNPRSVICSSHFVGGTSSRNPQSPSYVPTIFPNVYKRKICDPEQTNTRFKRLINRQKFTETVPELNQDSVDEENNKIISISKSTQVSFNEVPIGDENFVIMNCNFNGNDVGVQTTISIHKKNQIKPTLVDKNCGPDSFNSYFYLSSRSFYGFESIENEDQIKDLTGASFNTFNLLLGFLPTVTTKSVLNEKNSLLLFLIKIKLGITFSALSVFFKINRRTVSRIFFKTLHILSIKTKHFIFWPDKYSITQTLPESFKKNFPNCRAIIDCTEFKVEQPNTVEQRVYLYSRYKSCFTIKVLVAVTPNGMVSFLSQSYGGRASDSYITNDSGFLNLLEKDDEVLADRGFPGINTQCENNNAIIIMPPICHNGRFTEDEVLKTYSVASVRIHIERIFARLKTYAVLNKIKINILPHVDDIIHICCVLTNLQLPIIKQ